jgi:hypothetical protein
MNLSPELPASAALRRISDPLCPKGVAPRGRHAVKHATNRQKAPISGRKPALRHVFSHSQNVSLFQFGGTLRGGRNYGLKSRDFPKNPAVRPPHPP